MRQHRLISQDGSPLAPIDDDALDGEAMPLSPMLPIPDDMQISPTRPTLAVEPGARRANPAADPTVRPQPMSPDSPPQYDPGPEDDGDLGPAPAQHAPDQDGEAGTDSGMTELQRTRDVQAGINQHLAQMTGVRQAPVIANVTGAGDPLDEFRCPGFFSKCFPDLYPYGRCELYTSRPVTLAPAEYFAAELRHT